MSEFQSLAELTLESLTPFALEQLIWGYTWDREAGTLLVYAAYLERLKKEGYPEVEAFRQVYPDFLVLQNKESEQAVMQVLIRPEGVTVAAFRPRSIVPVQIVGAPTEGEADPQPIVHELIEELDESAFPLGDTIDQPVKGIVPNQGPIRFVVQNGEEEIHLSELPEEQTWPADLRSDGFTRREQSSRIRDLWLWRGMLSAAALVLLLLLLEGLRLGGSIWLQNREERIDTQTTVVAQIESRNSLVGRLEQRATSQLAPFQALRLMNRNRPPTIYFTSMDAEVPNRLVIDGVARTINEVNSYTTSLNGTGYFLQVDPRNVRSQGGQVTFTIELTLGELPAAGTEVAETTPNEMIQGGGE